MNNKITKRESFYLFFLFFIGNLVTASGAKGKPSGWLLFLIVALLSVPVLILYNCAAKKRTVSRIFIDSLGNKIGGILTGVYCILSVMLAGDSMRLFADFIVINDLNDAGAWGNAALLTITVYFLLNCNGKSLGKTAWMLQPIVALMLLLSIGLTIPKMEIQRLLPLLSEEPVLLVKEGLASFAAGTAAAMLPFFALQPTTESGGLRSAIYASVFAYILLAILAIRDTSVLGFPAVSMFRFPTFAAAGILRHSEILIAAAFVLSQPFRTVLCLRYVQICFNELQPRWQKFYPPALLGLAVLSGTLSWSSEQVRWRTAGELSITLLFLIGPVAVVIADWLKERNPEA